MSDERRRARRKKEQPHYAGRRKLVLLGAGRNSVDILDILAALDRSPGSQAYECLGFLDDVESLWGKMISGRPVLGPLSSAGRYGDAWFVNGIGSPDTFWRKDEFIARSGVPPERFATLVHPSASISATAEVGAGTVIYQNVVVGSCVRIGRQVLICPNALVSHDCVVGDHTCVAGGVSVAGGVRVGRLCYLGMGCAIREYAEIGDGSLVGMGSLVLRNVPANSIVFGSPARFRKPMRAISREDRKKP